MITWLESTTFLEHCRAQSFHMFCKLQIILKKQEKKKPLRRDSILTALTKITVSAAKITAEPLNPGNNWLLAQPFEYCFNQIPFISAHLHAQFDLKMNIMGASAICWMYDIITKQFAY